jgi:hypothetical protein
VASLPFRPEQIHAPGESNLGFEYLKPFLFRGPAFSHRMMSADFSAGLAVARITRIHEELQAGHEDYPPAVEQ